MTRAERAAQMKRDRDAKVLGAALALAQAGGYATLTRDLVAQRAGVASGCVTAAYGSMSALRDAVMRHAVAHQMLEIVAQGLACAHEIARNADPDLKARAALTLA